MFTQYRKIAGVLSGILLTPLAWASQLQDVKFSELPGDRVEIRLKFDEAPAVPEGYTIEQPARIVLDFAEVENALTQKKFTMDMGSVSSAVVIAGGSRTRLIVNMNDLQPYSTRVDGSDLVMEVGGGASQASAVAKAAAIAQSTPVSNVLSQSKNRFDKSVSEIQNIDFRRGDNGEGKVIVQLSNPSVSIDVEEVAGGIEIGFLQTELPDQLRRKLDVTDFATPVNMIDATSGNLRSVLKIDASGEYDYLAYQAENEYVVSIKPLTPAEVEEKKAKFAYTGEKLSLNFQNIEVRSVLQLIADFTDLNLVASDTVKGSITLRLDNVPWDQALELVLKTKGLDKRQVGNVLMVAPAAEIAERERQELATQKQLEELAPLRTEYIRVRYANARELFDLFVSEGDVGGGAAGGSDRNSTGSILSDRGHAIVDERTNSIILTDTEEKINDFRRVIEQVDIPIRQVMIEARIVIANNDFRKELGTRINIASQNNFNGGSNQVGFTGSMDELFNNASGEAGTVYTRNSSDPDDNGETITDVASRVVDLGVTDAFGNFTMGLISGDVLLGLEISALEESGYAEIVSQPKVITGDKQQASIENGTEIPYIEAAASGAGTITFREAVLKLDVTPQITPDDNVIMDLTINQDSVGRVFQNIPSIDVTELNTQVLVADGQTVVLGGIFQNESGKQVSKVPLLGDIPVIGRLFRKNTNSETKRELIIFITPRIMSSTLTSN